MADTWTGKLDGFTTDCGLSADDADRAFRLIADRHGIPGAARTDWVPSGSACYPGQTARVSLDGHLPTGTALDSLPSLVLEYSDEDSRVAYVLAGRDLPDTDRGPQ